MKLTDINKMFSDKDYIEAEFKELEKRCLKENIALIDRDAADFLKIMLKVKNPKKILEIGSALGFSALLTAKYTSQKSSITAVEIDAERAAEAEAEIAKTDYSGKIDIKVGDALDILMYLKGKYDFIFLDAAKGQYLYLFEYIMELLEPGGILLADNVLFKAKVLSDKDPGHKHRTIVKNLKKYLKLVLNHPELDSTVITAGDGMALSRRKDNDG